MNMITALKNKHIKHGNDSVTRRGKLFGIRLLRPDYTMEPR